ncbi:MAG TPA: hypothetical protein VFH68_02525 [Polyangia bacterium]|nr:hypothetical protein [Polyangia bacterium]
MRSRSAVAAGALMAGAALAGWLVGCSTPTPPISLHNLERPTDVVFSCVGLSVTGTDDSGQPTLEVSGRPMSECHVPGRFDKPPDLAHRTFGFVTNTARGELSVINMDTGKLVDLDPSNPETNVAPLGVLPEQISASDDGCRIVSANRGSCDLTLVDTGALVMPQLALEGKLPKLPTQTGVRPPVSQQVVVRTASGKPLKVAPYEAWFLPQDTSALTTPEHACGAHPSADPIGWNPDPTKPAETQWKALVSFPSCNLVALVDLPSGEIVDSVQVVPSSDGTTVDLVPMGAEPVCAETDFCNGSIPPDDTSAPDAGVAPAAINPDQDPFVNPAGTRPGPMTIRPGGERVYVGLGQAAFVVALDIGPGQLRRPAMGATIQLHDHALGVNRVRLSIDPYKATGIPGQHGGFVGEGELRDRQYLYVIARDGTLRIVDVSRSTRGLKDTECDANIDPAKFPPGERDSDPRKTCWPVDDPADADHRLALAQGPGLRFSGLVPRDVAAVDLTSLDPRNDWEGVLDGAYAFVLTSNGAIFIVNIAPTLRDKTVVSGTVLPSPIAEVEPLANSLRDRNILTYTTSMDATTGPPRLDLDPTAPVLGPTLLGIKASLVADNVRLAACATTNPLCVLTYAFFPQRSAVQRQTWNVLWQGDVFGPSFSGNFQAVVANRATAERRLALSDLGVGFCAAGVLPGDFVTLFGCTADNQCGPSQVCKRSDSAPESVGTLNVNGLCMLTDAEKQAQQLSACAPLLDSVRRYEIVDATETLLSLRPRLDEIVSSTFANCAHASPGAPCGPSNDPSRSEFKCLNVEEGGGLRCVQPCVVGQTSPACRSGRACVDYPRGSFCADAPTIDDSFGQCLNQLTAYKVGAGNAFLVQGTAPTPYHPGRPDATTMKCVADPDRRDRIPLFRTKPTATMGNVRQPLPECDPAVEVKDDFSADAVGAEFLSRMTTGNPQVIAAPCLVQTKDKATDMPVNGGPYYALFQNRELRFVLANLEAYLGDSLQITFDVHGGFQPDTVLIPGSVQLDAPARIVVSPIDSQGQASDLSSTHELPFLFVVDQRRLARANAGVSATRGQVLRVYSRKPTGSDANSLLPVYDDLTSSGGLWPVQ